MTGSSARPPRDAEESRCEDTVEAERRAAATSVGAPLPGVMDFLGAHVGGELAEERWR